MYYLKPYVQKEGNVYRAGASLYKDNENISCAVENFGIYNVKAEAWLCAQLKATEFVTEHNKNCNCGMKVGSY